MKQITLGKEKNLKQNFYKFKNNDLWEQKNQISLLNKIYLNGNDENKKFIIQEINKKINSYKNQDLAKSISIETLINQEEVLEKLVASKLKCFYCKNNILLFYKFNRDEKQWSLDRINNDIGHSYSNTLISCLQCNLQRRCKKF